MVSIGRFSLGYKNNRKGNGERETEKVTYLNITIWLKKVLNATFSIIYLLEQDVDGYQCGSSVLFELRIG